MPTHRDEFRRQLLSGAKLVGSFVKTPGFHAVEILGEVGFDFVVLDEEHAALDRAARCRPARLPGLRPCRSRTRGGAGGLLGALDCGAAGMMVPHVASEAQAREAASLCRYRGGRRGFSGSPRAGRYGGMTMADMIEAEDATAAVIAQIEDLEALDVIDAIAAVPGIDALFLGRADLAVAIGLSSPDAPEILEASLQVIEAARSAAKPVCAFAGDAADAAWLGRYGVTALVLSSDQGFLRAGAARALDAMRSA